MKAGFFLFLLPFFSSAQETFRGKVVDAYSGNAVPYATIGLIQQNTGTNSNELGDFSISCNQPDKDSLLISCIGYNTIRLPVMQLKSNPVISLSITEKQLPTVVVKNRWINEELGKYTILKNHFLTSNGYQSQVAKKLTASTAGAWLRSVKVQTDRNGTKSRFRLRVYDIDPVSSGPGNELTDTLIQVNSKGGTTSIDMSPYQIWLPGKDFFVALEWLKIPFNESGSFTHPRSKETTSLYKPKICFTKEAIPEDKDIWYLTYSGFWTPMVHFKLQNGIAISATVSH